MNAVIQKKVSRAAAKKKIQIPGVESEMWDDVAVIASKKRMSRSALMREIVKYLASIANDQELPDSIPLPSKTPSI